MSLLYHLSKSNVILDTLSPMTMGSVFHVEESKKYLVKYVHRLAHLGIRLDYFPNHGFIVHHNSESSMVVEMKSKTHLDT